MKKQKVLIYLLSGLIPTLIFFICATIIGYIPFGDELLNIYDSFTQYPGMLLEFGNRLKSGYLFYSWNAGLGFNFFGTLTYYAASPLNILAVFANEVNYPFFIAGMTYLRFFLLGISMCFYLSNRQKNVKPLYTVMFSTIYALMGYTSAYYYNYLWIDSVIMLPLVIHGLDILLEKRKPTFYIVTLTITILINYYIGYMICIFCLIYFLYRLVVKNKKEWLPLAKRFTTSSILCGLMGAVVIIPSYFALTTGKASLYSVTDYTGCSRNILTFFYTFLTGTYQTTDQSYGPALVYSTILVLVLTFFYFFNTKYSKKEKIATAIVIAFFYLSFSVNALNFAWHFFQKPIWWQSRFAFVFSFFLITLAMDTLINIDKTKFKIKHRIILSILFMILAFVGAYYKWQVISRVELFTYFYIFLGVIIFLEIMFLLDKKYFLPIIILCTFIDISINTFNNLKANQRNNSYINYTYLKEGIPKIIEELNEENEYFYRFELMNDYTSDDGLYFNFHGMNYFNSVRNIRPINLMEKLGLKVADKCHVFLNIFDPAFLSLFNFKYLYGEMDYFKKVKNFVYENPYPLSIGFLGNENIKDTKLTSEDYRENITRIYSDLLNEDVNLYKKIDHSKFKLENLYLEKSLKEIKILAGESEGIASYKFVSDGHYLFMPYRNIVDLVINDEKVIYDDYFIELFKGDVVEVSYTIRKNLDANNLFIYLLDITEYEKVMEKLSTNVLRAKEDINGHILEGTIEVPDDESYLFTSIEYEEGMTIYVDGKETKFDVILDALIGLKLDKGTHKIWIDYTPKGLKIGIVISIISFVTMCFYLQKIKKKL